MSMLYNTTELHISIEIPVLLLLFEFILETIVYLI